MSACPTGCDGVEASVELLVDNVHMHRQIGRTRRKILGNSYDPGLPSISLSYGGAPHVGGLSREAAMFNPASSITTQMQTVAEAPLARKVISEIGMILALHLAFALAVTVVLQAFGEF